MAGSDAFRRPIVACFKEWGAALVLGILLTAAAPMAGAQAQSGVPCYSFIRNPDGSWTATGNVPFPVAGRVLNLQQGSVMKPGFFILGTDVAATLAASCASVPVQQPQAEITTLADDKGVIDMATLACGQLLSVYQEDATHNVIVYCKANLTKRVNDAIEAQT
jgi:hypothetical protein